MVIAISICVLIFLVIIIDYNIIISSKNKVKQSKSSIDIYLTQRFDLIPNLVEIVKEYTKHESDIFTKIAELRTAYYNNKDIKVGEELANKMNTVMAIGESNPNLLSSEQFLNLQNALIKMESQLQAARRIYNGDVTLYNTLIQRFPTNIIATFFNFKPEELFTVEEYKKSNIKVEI